jgi:hypothetical protein
LLSVDALILRAQQIYPLLVAAVLSGSVIGAEYEEGTDVLTNQLDVTPRRWVISKTVLLAGFVCLESMVVWLFSVPLGKRLIADKASPTFSSKFDALPYEILFPEVLAYSFFAVALGALVACVVRKLIPTLLVTVALTAGARFAFVELARPRLLPAAKAYSPAAGPGPTVPNGSLILHQNLFADTSGHATTFPKACELIADYVSCLRGFNITQRATIFQPPSHLLPMHLIEFGCFAVLGLLALAAVAVVVPSAAAMLHWSSKLGRIEHRRAAEDEQQSTSA